MALKIISLIVFIMFLFTNTAKFSRGHAVSAANIFVMAASAVGFVYSMGWLS